MKEELSKNKSHEQPLKEKMVNTELAKLKATIQNLEKKNMELEELRQRMENLEKKLVVINQNGINQKGDKGHGEDLRFGLAVSESLSPRN